MFGSEFLAAFTAVLNIVILIAIGYILTFKKIITKEISEFITWLVLNISLPCLMAKTILTSFSEDEIRNIPKAIALPFFTIIICYGVGYVLAKLLKTKKEHFGQMIAQTAQNNTIFMGLPVNIALLGEISVPFVLYYYMANTILFWTLGVYCIVGEKDNVESGNIFKKLASVFLSPAIFALIISLMLLSIHLKLPEFMITIMSDIGSLTTPLSMFFIGYVLCNVGLKNIRFEKDVTVGLIARFVIGPAISLSVFSLFNLPNLMMNVYTIQSFMPVMANSAIVAERYGSASKYAAVMIATSTILSLIILPLVKVLFVHIA